MKTVICQNCQSAFETNINSKVYCNRICKNRAMNKKYNRGCQQSNRGLIKKAMTIKERGGKCSVCGYDKNLSSITFHHINPKEKLLPLDIRTFANRNSKEVEKEVKKCIVVCRNCHGEIEHPQYNNWKEKWLQRQESNL